MRRRHFLALAAAAASTPVFAAGPGPVPPPTPRPSDLLGAAGDKAFLDWLNDFYGRAIGAGVSRALLDRELSGIAPDPRITASDASQPEFQRPVSDYIKGVISDDRIAIGRAKRTAIPQFPAIEAKYGVPRDILIGVWAMESGFGKLQGGLDVLRSLATLAAAGRRREWAEGELMALFKIIASGEAARAQLKGSWAGAMGQTQFIPSAYLNTAVDGDGDGKRDIWNSAPDALASAANLLLKGGWRRGESWAVEVSLPARGFDYSLTEGPKDSPAVWKSRGVNRADGRPWSGPDAASTAQLLLPSGATGPAFFAFPNHFAIRTYNNSTAYALGVGLLADRFAGGGPLKAPWPVEARLSLTDRMAAQEALAKLGFNPGAPDGAIGTGTRQALRAWQKSRGFIADGYLSPDMIAKLKAAAGN